MFKAGFFKFSNGKLDADKSYFSSESGLIVGLYPNFEIGEYYFGVHKLNFGSLGN